MPAAVAATHIALLAGVVLFAHHPVVFLGIFLMFLGYTQAYARHQSPLILKEALLVGFFLAGQSCSLQRINRPSSSGSSWLSRGSPTGPGRSMVVNGNYSFALRFPAVSRWSCYCVAPCRVVV